MMEPTATVRSPKDVPELLLRLRQQSGMTQQQVAAQLDLRQSQISGWENGVRLVPLARFLQLLDLYRAAVLVTDVTAQAVLDGDPPPVGGVRTIVVRSPAEVGHGLRMARSRAGMTQQQVANAAGVDQSGLSKWEQGVPPPLAPLMAVCAVLNVAIVFDGAAEGEAGSGE